MQRLCELFAELQDPAEPNLMLQEYIPGGDDTIWMFNGYFDQDSECLMGFTGKKIRQCPIHTGSTSLGICLHNQAVYDTTLRFMKAIGYRGVLDIGYRYDTRTGDYKVLDVNPRIGATFRLFADSSGNDVVRAQYWDMTGQAVPTGSFQPGRKWMVEDLDLVSSFRYMANRELTPREWLTSYRGVDESVYLDLHDPLPLIANLRGNLKILAQRALRRAHIVPRNRSRQRANIVVNGKPQGAGL